MTQICEVSLPNLKSLAGVYVDVTYEASSIPKLKTTSPNLQHLEISLRDDWIHINFPMYRVGRIAERKYDWPSDTDKLTSVQSLKETDETEYYEDILPIFLAHFPNLNALQIRNHTDFSLYLGKGVSTTPHRLPTLTASNLVVLHLEDILKSFSEDFIKTLLIDLKCLRILHLSLNDKYETLIEPSDSFVSCLLGSQLQSLLGVKTDGRFENMADLKFKSCTAGSPQDKEILMKDQKDTNNRWVKVTKLSISWHAAMGT